LWESPKSKKRYLEDQSQLTRYSAAFSPREMLQPWVTSPIQNGYTQQGLATLLQHTLVSCVLGAGSQLVKQVRGLPMGIRPAPPPTSELNVLLGRT